jgi:hypothetical protein
MPAGSDTALKPGDGSFKQTSFRSSGQPGGHMGETAEALREKVGE